MSLLRSMTWFLMVVVFVTITSAEEEEEVTGRCGVTGCGGGAAAATPQHFDHDLLGPLSGISGSLLAIPILILQIITIVLLTIALKSGKEEDSTGYGTSDYSSGYSSYRSLYPSHETLGTISNVVNNAIDAYNRIDLQK